MNIPKHADVFAKEMKRRNYCDNTIKNYSSNIASFFKYFNKKEHPLHINESDIKDYLATFKCTNTQRSNHGAIKMYYDICLNQKDKFKYIPYARKEQKLPIVLSVEEIQQMFNVCTNEKHRVILGLLYSCGLRVSELINLKWKDIDRSRMIINVIAGKGNKDRQIMLAPTLIPLLEKYYHEYHSKVYVLNGWKDELQYTQRSVLEVVKQLAAKAGIDNKRVYTHLIRHCAFTHLAEQGTDIRLIQRIAGHTNSKTTDLYLHLSHNLISKINSPINNIKL